MDTEEQQVERIKEFWQEHGKGLVAGAIIGFGLFYGWRYYDAQTIANQESASEQFEVVSAQLAEGGEEAAVAAQDFLQNSGDSSYAMLAAFALAQQAVEQNDYATAVSALQHVRDNGELTLRSIADVRQARILLAQQQYDAALNALNTEKAPGFGAVVAELRGDVLLAQGDQDGAREAYQAAVDSAENVSGTLQLKLDNLAVNS